RAGANRCRLRDTTTLAPPLWFPAGAAWSSVEIREPQGDLALGRLGRVRAVHEVLAVGQRQVAANGAGRRLPRVRGAVEEPDDLDRVVPLEDRGHQRSAGHE